MFPAASPDAIRPIEKNWDSADLAAAGIVAVYAVLQVMLAIWHDPWLDEAQGWLVATSLSRPIDFFILPSEGHPPLWHWLLRAISTVLDFSQARYLTVIVAIANAWLLSRLLRGMPLLLLLMLGSFVLLQSWGYGFRPYGLVFMALLGALLLDRRGRRVASTWVLAIACGLHFFAGFLFAFWLIWHARNGTAVLKLLPPALLAAAFGGLAIVSGLGNTSAGAGDANILGATLNNLGWAGLVLPLRGPIFAVLTIGALIYGLRSQPLLLAALLALLITFALGSAVIYGKYPWHFAFMTMLCFMALAVAGFNRERQWVLVLLLVPQFAFGMAALPYRFAHPAWIYPDLYEAVVANAGPDFRPETDLVAWPDMAGVPFAAVKDITLVNGNVGTLLGPLDWRQHHPEAFAPVLTEHTGPYWLICAGCDPVLAHIEQAGRTPTLLASKFNVDNGEFNAYRVD